MSDVKVAHGFYMMIPNELEIEDENEWVLPDDVDERLLDILGGYNQAQEWRKNHHDLQVYTYGWLDPEPAYLITAKAQAGFECLGEINPNRTNLTEDIVDSFRKYGKLTGFDQFSWWDLNKIRYGCWASWG